ncbi:MAG: hypothetical protein ACYDCC_05850 [Actinomycetota bacterium]
MRRRVWILYALLGLSMMQPSASKAITASDLKTQADWIASLQISTGPDAGLIPLNQPRVRCVPYFANIAATGLAAATHATGDSTYVNAAWTWLNWYANHMDATGFVTDYQLDSTTNAWTSTDSYDSTDSYAATFIVAMRDAYDVSHDATKLQSLWPAARKAAGALQATAGTDHLTFAKPGFTLKYLMDNAEVYEAWVALDALAGVEGDSTTQSIAQQWISAMPASLDSFWNPSKNGYDVAISDTGAHVSLDWSELYPSSAAQAWMIDTGLVSASRAQALTQKIDQTHPSWDDPVASDTFDVTAGSPTTQSVGWWPEIADAFAIAGNTTRSATAIDNMLSSAASTSWAWPYHVGSSGRIVYLADPSPTTALNQMPASITNATSATFAFSSSTGSSFQCAIDGAAYSACSSPFTSGVEPEGSHTFYVRAEDALGHLDPTPAQWTWRIDTTPPTVSITSTPPNPANATPAVFSFTGTDDVSTTLRYQCSIDSGAFVGCEPGSTLPQLQTGTHSFSVRSVDQAGNVSSAASYSWFADTQAPHTQITSPNPKIVTQPSVSVSFSATDDVTQYPTFQCTLNGRALGPCTSPFTISTTSEGVYVFNVAGVDAAGNVDPTPAVQQWIVDHQAPSTRIQVAPNPFTNDQGASIDFEGFDAVTPYTLSYQCSLDHAAFSLCTPPIRYSGLIDGTHTFDVRAINGAGIVDPNPAHAEWIVDTTPPTTSVSTADGAILGAPIMGDQVQGTATDDRSGIDHVLVTFTPPAAFGKPFTTRAWLQCDSSQLNCTWSAQAPQAPGPYTVDVLTVERSGLSDLGARRSLGIFVL